MVENKKTKMFSMLAKQYNILCDTLTETQADWSALAYKATSKEKNFFIKVYDKQKHTSRSWISRIDDYMPILLWLEQNTGLKGEYVPHAALSHIFR